MFLSCRCHVADILCEDTSDDLSIPVCLLEALLQVQYFFKYTCINFYMSMYYSTCVYVKLYFITLTFKISQ